MQWKVTPYGSFVYLGSLTTAKGASSPEIRRRIIKAREVCRSLGKVWSLKGLSLVEGQAVCSLCPFGVAL